MKYFFLMFTVYHVDFVISGNKINYGFYPNLPVGEYRMNIKYFLKCGENQDNDIMMNYYISKKSINTSEIRGNITLKIPLDDSILLHAQMAIKDSIGGWKNNAYVYSAKKACSQLKFFWGPEYPRYVENQNIHKTSCPIAPGVYISKGHPADNVAENTNIPKKLFYGSYRTYGSFLDKSHKEVGCFIVGIDVKRPWESS